MKSKTRLAIPIGIAFVAITVFTISALSRSAAATQVQEAGNAESCSSDRFPPGSTISQCCQDGNRTWHKIGGNLVYRTYSEPCREEDGIGTNCGVGSNPFKPCSYGPCGARNEWAITAENISVFTPLSIPNKCGWSAVNILDYLTCNDPDGCGRVGGTRDYPESYVSQELYGGLTGTCPYTRCLVGGIPAPPAQ